MANYWRRIAMSELFMVFIVFLGFLNGLDHFLGTPLGFYCFCWFSQWFGLYWLVASTFVVLAWADSCLVFVVLARASYGVKLGRGGKLKRM